MKKTLTLLLICATLIPSFSYAYGRDDICTIKSQIKGIALTPDRQANSWKISYKGPADHNKKQTLIANGYINLDTAAGRATFALAINAMNMAQPVWLASLSHNNEEHMLTICNDFASLWVGEFSLP